MANNLKNIEINGRQLHYVEHGEGRPPVIFIHGGLDDYRCWQIQADYFSGKYRTISYSRRFAYPNKWIGNVAEDNTIEANASDLAEMITKLDLAPAHLVGASYGAFIALYCASKNPGIARTLVLNEPPILEFLARSSSKEDVGLLEQFRSRVLLTTRNASVAGDFRKAAQVAIDGIMGIENYFGQLPEEFKQFLIDNARSLESELESSLSTPFNAEDVKRTTTIPALLVKGELSPKYFLRITDILSRSLPDAGQIVLPNVSHDDFKSCNNFSSKVMEFFSKHR